MSQLIVNQDGVTNPNGIFLNPSNVDATYYNSAPNGLSLGKSVLASGAFYNYSVIWLRFQLNLVTEVTLDSAYLRFTTPDGWYDAYIGGSLVAPEFTARINAHKVLDSSGPVSHAEAVSQSDSAGTTATVNWTSKRYGPGAIIVTPDITTILREILDQGSWASGNYVTFYIKTYLPTIGSLVPSRRGVITNQVFQDNNPTWTKAPNVLEDDARPRIVVNYTEDPVLPGTYDQYVESVLTIEQVYDGTLGKAELEHILVLEQDIVYVHNNIRAVWDDLEIEQDYKPIVPIERTVNTDVFITHAMDRGVVRPIEVEHELSITQDIIRNTEFDKQIVDEILVENDAVDYSFGYSKTIESVVDLTQDVDQNIHTRSIVHSLYITDTISTTGSILSNPEVVTSTLTVEQDIDWNRNGERPVTHDLTIQHFVVGYFDVREGCDRQDINYQPYADSSVDFPTEPVLTYQDITLEYPTTSPTHSITLPVPLFGDREEMLITRIQRQTRGGVIKTFTQSDWPKIRTFRYKFDSLPTSKITEMFTFLGVTLGLKMRLTDHEGRQWDGYIVNPQGEAGQFMRICGNTTEFDFEGVEV